MILDQLSRSWTKSIGEISILSEHEDDRYRMEVERLFEKYRLKYDDRYRIERLENYSKNIDWNTMIDIG